MTDHSAMKLGRVAPTPEQHKRALPLARYTTRPLPPAPPKVNNTDGAPIAMFGNDRFGDCTFAALANYRAICSAKEGLDFPTTEADVVKAYFDFTGGDDSGAVETEVLNCASSTGVQLGGDEPWRLATWVSVPLRDEATCKSLISIFWSLYLGVELPNTAKFQDVWKAPIRENGNDAPGSWGGHALLWPNFDENLYGLVTWGGIKLAEPGWIRSYCEEAYLPLDEDRAKMIGVDFDALLADLASVPA